MIVEFDYLIASHINTHTYHLFTLMLQNKILIFPWHAFNAIFLVPKIWPNNSHPRS